MEGRNGDEIVLRTYDRHQIVENKDCGDTKEVDDVVLEEDMEEGDAIVDSDLLWRIFDSFIEDEAEQVKLKRRCCR